MQNATAADEDDAEGGGLFGIFASASPDDEADAEVTLAADAWVSTNPLAKWNALAAKRVPTRPGKEGGGGGGGAVAAAGRRR